MDIDWIEDRIDVFIENSIKEHKLRRNIDYAKKILHKRDNNDSIILLDSHSSYTGKCNDNKSSR